MNLIILLMMLMQQPPQQAHEYPLVGHVSWASWHDRMTYDTNSYTVSDEHGSATCTFSSNSANCHSGGPIATRWATMFDPPRDNGPDDAGTVLARLGDGREVVVEVGEVSSDHRELGEIGVENYHRCLLGSCPPDPLRKILAASPVTLYKARQWAKTDAAIFHYRLVKEWTRAVTIEGRVLSPASDAICLPFLNDAKQKWGEECYDTFVFKHEYGELPDDGTAGIESDPDFSDCWLHSQPQHSLQDPAITRNRCASVVKEKGPPEPQQNAAPQPTAKPASEPPGNNYTPENAIDPYKSQTVSLVHARADSLNEADYPSQYEVMNTSTISGSPLLLMPGICTMALRDLAYSGTGIVVQRKGSCHVWDAGTVFHGRREKSGISLLVQDKGKLKVEHWPITGTVAINPQVSAVSVAAAEKNRESVPEGDMGILSFASIPDGADIYVDGDFMGNSPAALKLKLGKHTIKAKMSGYHDWDREITISGGTVNLNAKLTVGSSSSGSNSSPTTTPETPAVAAGASPRNEGGWIGLSTATSEGSAGATVVAVYPGGPAALAGLKVGDVITQVEEKTVTSSKVFQAEIMHYKPGSQVKVRYMRGASLSEVTVMVGRE